MNLSAIALYSPHVYTSNQTQRKDIAFKNNETSEISKHTQEALNVSNKLLKLKPEELSIDKIRRYFNIHLLPFTQIQNASTEVAALDYTLSLETGEIDKKSLTIFTPEFKKGNKIAKTIFIMNLAHEYTHAQQILSNNDANQILLNNLLKAGFSKEVFIPMQRYAYACYDSLGGDSMRSVMYKIMGEEGKESYQTTGGLTLINRKVDENIIAQAIGYKDAITAKKNLKSSLSKALEAYAYNLCLKIPEINKKFIYEPDKTLNTIKNLLLEYCKTSSQMEKEAYLAENIIAKKQGFDDKGSELTYKYHALIEETLA